MFLSVNPGTSTPLPFVPLAPSSPSEGKHDCLWQLSNQRTIVIFQHSSSLPCVTFSVDSKHILSGGHDKKIAGCEVPSEPNGTSFVPILAITTARNTCIAGDLETTEELLTQEIDTDANSYTSYANRSVAMARKHSWDVALDDAIKSISIQPSLTGYISRGVALCGKGHIWVAGIAFDAASMFTNRDPETNHFLLLMKAITLFNAAY
ncbi:hypothetical protein BDR07DRAFT_1490880 [Suillus spraguei]|nr:hypothetical protein BDR07DRAFT_1490880 [Suillus spraguei]